MRSRLEPSRKQRHACLNQAYPTRSLSTPPSALLKGRSPLRYQILVQLFQLKIHQEFQLISLVITVLHRRQDLASLLSRAGAPR